MRRIAVEHDLQLASAGGKKLRDKAIGVAQFRNADLGNQIDDGGFSKKEVSIKSTLEPHHDHITKLCRATVSSLSMASPVAWWGENSPGAGSTDNPEPCLASSERRKLASSRLECS